VKLLPSTEYSHNALTQWLNAKYSNRVLHKVGLCISVYDILSVGDGALKYGDGCVYIKTEFRMTVFRPFVREVITGRIMSATHRGIRLSLEFFDDIYIPAHLIFPQANFDHTSQSWRLPVSETEWNYLEKDDNIRFRVEEETFKEATPAPPKAHGSGEIEHRVEEHKEPVYSLIGSCQEDGLGVAAWWDF